MVLATRLKTDINWRHWKVICHEARTCLRSLRHGRPPSTFPHHWPCQAEGSEPG